MSNLIEQLKTKYKNGNLHVKLIFIMVGIFLASKVFEFLFRESLFGFKKYLILNTEFAESIQKPWTLLTYAFLHHDLMHIGFNMLLLYFVGQMFLRYFRKEDFLTFFLFGTLSGGLAYMALSQILNYNTSYLLGASAAVYALFIAMATYMPNTKVQLMFLNFNIPLSYLAYALLGYDLLMIINGNNTGGHVAHLGGAAFGFLYMKQFEKGNDFLGGIIRFLFFKSKEVKLRTDKKTRYQKESKPPRNDYEFNAQKVEKQKKVDVILDKISRSGYDSLTKEEKDFLFKASNNG